MCEKEKKAAVIRNVSIMEDALSYVQNSVEDPVFHVMNKSVAGWAQGRQWHVVAELFEEEGDNETRLAPSQWRRTAGDDESWDARYWLSLRDDDDDITWLGALLKGNVGFSMMFEHHDYGINLVPWRRMARAWGAAHPQLRELGFEFMEDKGRWFLPFRIEAEALAQAVEKEGPWDISEALAPLQGALEVLEKGVEHFQGLVNQMRAEGQA